MVLLTQNIVFVALETVLGICNLCHFNALSANTEGPLLSLECNRFMCNRFEAGDKKIGVILVVEFFPVDGHLNNTIQRLLNSFTPLVLILEK